MFLKLAISFSLSGARQQQVGEHSQSLVPVYSKEVELRSPANRRVLVNKNKYLNRYQNRCQVLARPNLRNTIVLEVYKCLVCGASTIMHIEMIPCMRDSNRTTNGRLPANIVRSRQRQICGTSTTMSQSTAMVPYTAVVPYRKSETKEINLCCPHCNLQFDNEEQVLRHGHIIKFKRKHIIK